MAPPPKKTVTLTPAAPPAQPPDLPVKDCRSALLYSDKAPLASKAKPGQWDLKATWAHVPSPRPDKPSLLIFLHGFENYNTVDQNGDTRKPDWAGQAFAGAKGAPTRFEFAATAAKFKQPIVLLPEIAKPIIKYVPDPTPKDPKHMKGIEGVPAINSQNSLGNLGDAAALGDFVDDCFRLLTVLKTVSPPCSGNPLLRTKPALTDLQRLYLTGHSGGGVPLKLASQSKLVSSLPTDLVLFDATYGHDGGGGDFCKSKGKANMGNAAGQNRLIAICIPGTGTEGSVDALRNTLKTGMSFSLTTVSYDAKTKRPTTKPAWPTLTTNMVQITHFGDSTTSPSAANLDPIRDAMKQCPIVIVKTNVTHDSITRVFTPLVLDSAP